MADQNAVSAGWGEDQGDPPFIHGTPPEIDPETGVNGLPRRGTLAMAPPLHLGGFVAWPDVLAELQKLVGFREGPNNENPWGPEQGVSHASYCCSGACMIPYHHGYLWWPESQFGVKGNAYVPWHVKHAQAHGEWMFNTPKSPCDLIPGDQTVNVWPGGDGAGDHIETAIAAYPDGSYLAIGFNTGKPEGVWIVHRDRKYLHGRVRPALYSDPNPPVPPGGKAVAPYPIHLTTLDVVDWTVVGDKSWFMLKDGAVYAAPNSPGVPGVNGKPYWIAPTHHAGPNSALKIHVRQEGARFVSCVEDAEGLLFRDDGGPDFRTH